MNIIKNYILVFKKATPYSLYVLFVMLFTYMLNQLDRYALSITSVEIAQSLKYGDKACLSLPGQTKQNAALCKSLNQTLCENLVINGTNGTLERVCKYDYNGQGIEYQIVAGPIFIVVFTFTGILISLFADRFQNRRVLILTCCLIWWSSMTILTGFTKQYWQLALLRFALGIGEAGCNPLATSLIADYFVPELKGSAMGIYNWGIYTGYSLSFAIGNQILKYLDWRWVFIICGIPGILVGILIILTIKEPIRVIEEKKNEQPSTSIVTTEETNIQKLKNVAKEFLKPTLILLLLASSIRNAAGYVWGYNNNTYYKQLGQTPDQISSYLGIIPLIFGIIGSFVGGYVSDRVAKKAEPWTRIWVLVFSQLIAAPFVFGVLFFNPPYSYYFLIPAYIFGEMWVGVCLSVAFELVPERLRLTGISLYFFVITNIGGNMQILVPPVQNLLKKIFSLNDLQAFRGALYIFYPGEYVIGSLLFLLTLFVIKRDIKKLESKRNETNINSVTNLLYEDYDKKIED